jgi:biotin carboxylase
MPAVATVSDRLGLRCFIRPETAELMRNKTLLRGFLAAHNISPVKYKKISCEADLAAWYDFPAIVKPADSQGQRGVFRAESMAQIRAGLGSSLAFSSSKTVIVEEFLDGPEVSANAFVIHGRVVLDEISDRLVVAGHPGGIPRGHVLPSKKCGGQALRETRALVQRCIQALDIENGPVYFQIKLTGSGPRIVEITPRLDGCHIWRLIKTVGGVDLIDASFRLLTGDNSVNLQMMPTTETHQLTFLLSPPGQVFMAADHLVPVQASHLEYRYRDGEVVRPVNGFMEVVGYYIAKE